MVPPSTLTSTQHDFDALYEGFAPRVRGLVRRRLNDRELVEDVVQETFLRAYRNRDALDPDRSPWPWLATVANNLCSDVLRRRLLREETTLWDDVGEPAAGSDVSVAAAPDRQAVVDALTAVGDRQRRLLVMHHLEGRPYQEIASDEGLSLEAVRSLLARGRRAFKEQYLGLVERRDLLPVAVPGLATGRVRRALSPRQWLTRWHAAEARVTGAATRAAEVAPDLAARFVATALIGGVAAVVPMGSRVEVPVQPVVVEAAPTTGVAARPSVPAAAPADVSRAQLGSPSERDDGRTRGVAPAPQAQPVVAVDESWSGPPRQKPAAGEPQASSPPDSRPVPLPHPGRTARETQRDAEEVVNPETGSSTEAEPGIDLTPVTPKAAASPAPCRGDDHYVQPVCDLPAENPIGPAVP